MDWAAGTVVPQIRLDGARDVEFIGPEWLEVRGDAGGPLQSGSVQAWDSFGVTIRNVRVVSSPRSSFSIERAGNLTLTNVESIDPWHLGVHGGGGISNILVTGSTFTGSSRRNTEIGWESGAMKLTRGTNVRVTNNVITDGNGPGVWFDIDVNGGVISGNTIRRHSAEGIFVEISRNVTVSGNVVDRAPTGRNAGRMDWLYGSGILVSTSYNVTVSSNTVSGSYHGITVIDQSGRGDTPPGYNASAYTIRNNVVSGVNKVGAAQDSGGNSVFEGTWTGNQFTNVNSYEWDNSSQAEVPADWL